MTQSKLRVLSSHIVHKNPWYQVREDTVEREDGTTGHFFIADTPGPGLLVVAMNEVEEIYLVKQFRQQTERWSWELPGGNAGEEELQSAARRELKEEAGLHATEIEEIGTFQAMNGMMSEIAHVFIAKGLTEGKTNQGEEEVITQIKKFTITQIMTLITSGELSDGQSITALLQAFLHLGYTIAK